MKNTKDFYDKTAMEWADKWYDNEMLLPYLKKFMSYLPKNPRVLDLCCGAGYESMRMKRLGADVTGLDFSEKSIQIAKERNPEIRFVAEDMLSDYSYIGNFDGCAVIAGLVHLPDEKLTRAFDMIYIVLKDNGFLFAVVKDGTGKDIEASFKTVNGEDYERNFYLHSLIDLKKYSAGKFELIKEAMPDTESQWKYYIFRKI